MPSISVRRTSHARVAAGNSVDDIHQLCDYAHRYGVRVYVTVNTLIYEDEIDKAYQVS